MPLGLTLWDEAHRVMRMCGPGGWLILCLTLGSSCGKDRPKGGEDQAPPEDGAGVARERVGAGAAGADSALKTRRPPDRTDSSPTRTEMKDVDFQIAEGIGGMRLPGDHGAGGRHVLDVGGALEVERQFPEPLGDGRAAGARPRRPGRPKRRGP